MPRKLTKRDFINKKILHRDKEVYKSFFNVGILREKDILELGMSKSKFRQLEKFNLVEKLIVEDRLTKENLEVYKLSKVGKDFVKNKMCYERQYYNSNSYEHDIGGLKFYMDLRKQDPSFKADMWRNESELRDMFKEHLKNLRDEDYSRYNDLYKKWEVGEISPPDFCVVKDGQAHYIEITTSSYTQEMIEAKQEFSNLFNSEITFCRTY